MVSYFLGVAFSGMIYDLRMMTFGISLQREIRHEGSFKATGLLIY